MEAISKTLYAEQKILDIFLHMGFTRNQIEREIHAFNHKLYKYEEAAKSLLFIHFMKTSTREGMDLLEKVFFCDFNSVEFVCQLRSVTSWYCFALFLK